MNKEKFREIEMIEILKLEELFHNRFLTPDLLNQMIGLYVKGVQQFKGDYLFMRSYFLDKMHFVLSRPQIMKMLEKSQAGGQIVDTIRESIRLNHEEEVKVQQKHHHYEHHYHHDHKLKEKGTKIDMQMKVMREVEANLKNISKQVDKVDQKYQQKQKKIKNIAKDQNQKLQERLAKRKKKLRKKSVQVQPQKLQQDEPKQPIRKQQLIEAHREITEAVQRYTMRLTQKQNYEKQVKQERGRIKMNKIQEEEEQVEAINRKTEGRIKTRRVEDDEIEQW